MLFPCRKDKTGDAASLSCASKAHFVRNFMDLLFIAFPICFDGIKETHRL
jgi:hypothetical protein